MKDNLVLAATNCTMFDCSDCSGPFTDKKVQEIKHFKEPYAEDHNL